MRAASLLPFAVLLLLADCGSKQDLIIGELLLKGQAGAAAGASGASAGTEPTAGTLSTSGASGSAGASGGTSETGGAPDAGSAGSAGAAGSPEENCVDGTEPPPGSLIHRYSFEGTGTTATDTISAADGNIIGTMLDGSGLVTMDAKAREYVDLPNGIVSSLTEVTVITWTTWVDGAAYARVFDFGSSTSGEGLGDAGRSYFAVLPKTGFDNQLKPGLGAEMKVPGFATVTLASTEDMRHRFGQVAFVFKGGVSAALYLDGKWLASQPTAITPANIDDRNNWIGQSQYAVNPPYQGSYDEFRIYNVALDGCQLRTVFMRGPQTL